MSRQGRIRRISADDERYRPFYARVLRLRHLHPGPLPCFLFFEGSIIIGLLLALTELVPWWTILVLPLSVAVMVKANDMLAAALARWAALVPEQEQERFHREVVLAVGAYPTFGRARVARGGSSRGRHRPS